MSAPVTERQGSAAARNRTASVPTQRRTAGGRTAGGRSVPVIPAQRGAGRPVAAQRAYARRDDRVRRMLGGRQARTIVPAGRAQFILLVMVLLGAGLVATLWLSTAAAADSYRLQDARAEARALTEQSERLRREVATMSAAPALAQRASELGLVPVQDPARLVVGPDGSVQVVGTPKAAVAPAPPPPPPPPPAPEPAPDPAAGTDAAAAEQPPAADTAGEQPPLADTAGEHPPAGAAGGGAG
ncbi:hypothetical protein [Pseudonocardia asaccharolytica]|uniref:Cell division protein FtsL n=1 Tax=Pseudonocardia asaccharolytica DSM 44247 = NBRC 16224 TaxID=1123024 RepID=A0A511CXC1_9PSEU|nr:hypothetical protein [Pseudonocardia asaccharolytica]GEL17201.1 hypothetical protein PA7_10380 [Pseudonocardia asaccharolytica DSM 44247 = NBRC 16224]